jgi:DNA repair exonuclease SbcCD ATPase subunit
MLKRVFGLGAGLVTVVTALYWTGAMSYVRTAWRCGIDNWRGSIPAKFEIERARDMIKDLDGEIQRNLAIVAKGELGVEDLARQIATEEQRLVAERIQLLRLRDDMVGGQRSFRYGSRVYTRNEVRADLEARFVRFQRAEAALESRRATLEAREQQVAAIRDKLEGHLASKRDLETELENIQSRQERIEAENANRENGSDETRLGEVKRLVSDLRARVAATERLAELQTEFAGQIPVAEERASGVDVAEAVTRYFFGPAAHPDAVCQE